MKNAVVITIDEKRVEIQFQDSLLRDYFAAAALQGILANPYTRNDATVARLAEWAYMRADAMLKEGNKQP